MAATAWARSVELMIKTAVILAAGIGVRLRPLTLNTPKCLITIDDKSILDYQLKLLIKMGITKKFN